MQLIHLETILSFRVFYDLLGRSKAVLSLELIILHYWGKTFLSSLPTIS